MATAATPTSTLSSSTSAALATAASTVSVNKPNAQKLLGSLGAGSGVDVTSLAQNLVDAERAPQEAAINSKISKNEARISGYSAVSFVMNELKNKFSSLKVKSDFNTITVNNTDTNSFSVEPGAYATKGGFEVQVNNIAKGQRTLSTGFTRATDTLNAGNPFKLSLSIGGGAPKFLDVSSADATPSGVVSTINAAGLSVKAQLVNLGSSAPAVPSTSQIANVNLSNPPSADSFSAFTANVGGRTFSISPLTPSPNSNGVYDLAGLGKYLQAQLRAADGNNNLSVSLNSNGTGLEIKDLSGRTIEGVSMTPNVGLVAAAVPTKVTVTGIAFDDVTLPNFSGFTASIGGKSFELSNLSLQANSDGNYDLQSLANALQSQLRTEDGGTTNLSVAVNNNDLVITDALGRPVSNFQLTKDANSAGANTNEGTAVIENGSSAVLAGNVGSVSYSNGTTELKAYKILLTGDVGIGNAFNLTSDVAGLKFDNTIQQATNASVNVNGINYSRSTNKIEDILPGSTLTLRSASAGTALVSLDRDTSSIKTKITDLVTAFNDTNTILREVSNPKSTFETYGATLVSDSTVRMVQQQIRSMVLGNSSTPASMANGLWQIGISISQTGELQLDGNKLDQALKDNFDDIVTMFTGNKNLFISTGTDPAGLAGDAVRKITSLLGPQGPMLQQTETANKQNTQYKNDLIKLSTRMDALLARYTKQFSVMNSLVGQSNNLKTSLKSTFDGMMSVYTNK